MNKLYDYFRSSCSYRLRIALNLKHIPYESIPISLLKHEQYEKNYQKINPMCAVPSWIDENIKLTQSLAILEYLDEQYRNQPKLLPSNPIERAYARELAFLIACDIHPINNLRIKEYLQQEGWSEENILTWYHHWLKKGFDAFEENLTEKHTSKGHFCLGERISIADICLIPQVYNALRFKFNMQDYPKIMNIYNYCIELPAFIAAAPTETT